MMEESPKMITPTTNQRRSRALIAGVLTIATILCTYVSFDTSSSKLLLRSVVIGQDRPLEERDSAGFHRMLTAEVNDNFSAEQMKRVSPSSLR